MKLWLVIITFTCLHASLEAQESFIDHKIEQVPLGDNEKRTEKMRAHSISFNPFFIPLLSANLRYNYFFTKKMHWAINVRATYVSPILNILGDDTYLMMGAGIKYVPLYYKVLALGVDFTPTYIQEVFPKNYSTAAMMFPLSLNIDLIMSDKVGAAIDFGGAYVTGDVFESRFTPRFHVGIMFMFGEKRSIFPQYDSRF